MQLGAAGMSVDPTCTDSDKYVSIFENEWVRVLDYRDHPGQHTQPHHHPNSVMITLSDFRRRLAANGKTAEVDMTAGRAAWLPAQTHSGHNIGDTDTHVIFVELKAPTAADAVVPDASLGPSAGT
jgi:beta-alanine degradation protein BauB